MRKIQTPKYIGNQKWNNNPKIRKFVITGCGRSGTLFMTKVLKILGFTIGHENILKNGTSSWYLTERSHSDFIKTIFKGHDVTYIHIVRHPLDVIRSMWLCEHMKSRYALDFVREYYPKWHIEYDLTSVACWWIFWNMEAQKNYPFEITLPIEQLSYPDSFAKFCTLLKVKYYPKYFRRVKELGDKTHTIKDIFIRNLRKEYGTNILEPITFNEIKEDNLPLANTLRTCAKNYGYEL